MGEIIRFPPRAPQSVEAACIGHAGGPAGERLIKGAVRSLRRAGIDAWARRVHDLDPSYPEGHLGVLVRSEDEERGRAAFMAYVERVHRRATRPAQ